MKKVALIAAFIVLGAAMLLATPMTPLSGHNVAMSSGHGNVMAAGMMDGDDCAMDDDMDECDGDMDDCDGDMDDDMGDCDGDMGDGMGMHGSYSGWILSILLMFGTF